jgi:uncharacterized membrane protein
MRNFKIGFWAIIFGLVGIVIFQNQDFFMAKQSLSIDLILRNYKTPDLHIAVLFGGIFFIGFIISYIFTLIDRLRFRRVVKSLGATIDSQNENITSLINELETQKGEASSYNKEEKEQKEQKTV